MFVCGCLLPQSALRCVVSAGPQPSLSSLLWDSGVVETKDSVAVYTGPVLPSARTLFVAVSWRDSKGVFSPLSQWAVLRTAPAASAWAASSWIGKGFGMMRKTFMMSASRHSSSSSSSSSSPPVVAHVAGIGFHQLYVNGQRVSMDTPLAGDWTVWNTRVVYHSYDISSFLTPGAKNTIGVTLGHGWRNTTSFPYHFNASACADPLQRLLRMVVVADGDTTPMVATDDSWSGSSAGHVVFDSVYDGETHDMRKAQPTWSTPSFVPGSDWMGTVTVPTDCFDPTLTPLSIAPISIQAVRPALSVSRINATVQVVDFGDNLSGWARIRAQLPAGHAVEVRHAEVLMHEPYGPADGTVYTGNLRSAKATDVYIGAGDKEAQWYEPEGFTYHGFRYVQVTGYPGDLQLSDIQQVHFRTATRLQVALSTASNLLDRIQYGVAWGQGSNQMSVPTDCDQRDERLGWMGDAGLSADSFAINYDYSAFRANFLRAITDDQNGTTGSLPDVVPYQRYGNMPADPSWSAAYPQNIYVAYAVDNELAPARMYWDNLMHYFGNMAWQLQKAGGDMKNMSASYGDWVPADPTTKVDNSLPAAMNYVINVRQAAELAVALGKASDAANLTMWANTLVSDFNTAFKTQTPHGACWDMCGQAGYSMAYMAGAVDVTTDTNFTTQLVDDITHRYSNHPSSGIIGIKAMFPTLQVGLRLLFWLARWLGRSSLVCPLLPCFPAPLLPSLPSSPPDPGPTTSGAELAATNVGAQLRVHVFERLGARQQLHLGAVGRPDGRPRHEQPQPPHVQQRQHLDCAPRGRLVVWRPHRRVVLRRARRAAAPACRRRPGCVPLHPGRGRPVRAGCAVVPPARRFAVHCAP